MLFYFLTEKYLFPHIFHDETYQSASYSCSDYFWRLRHWDSVEAPVNISNEEVVTLETDEPENTVVIIDENTPIDLAFQQDGDEKRKKEDTSALPPVEEIPVIKNTNISIEVPVVVAPTPEVDPEPTVPDVRSTVRVYLYDAGLDLSSSSIPAGHVTFFVRNDGRLAHGFAIAGGEDFGRIKPGTSQTFSAPLSAGSYELFSSAPFDQTKSMSKTLVVE